MQITLFTAKCTGNKANCSYPVKAVVSSAEELQKAVSTDHVCAAYKNNYRGIDNFLSSDCLVMDIDNDHSDKSEEWITSERIASLFEDVDYALTTSRSHMLSKDGKTARPKFHIYFPIETCTDAKYYTDMKVAIQKKFSFFDGNALDAARFLFGAESQESVWHEGWMLISDLVEVEDSADEEPVSYGPILEGSRNNTMSRFAGRVLKRYGVTEKAHGAFLEHAKKCDPPLESEELKIIWSSAVRFFNKKIVSQDGYVSPEEYNADFEGCSLKPEDYSDIGEAKVLVLSLIHI